MWRGARKMGIKDGLLYFSILGVSLIGIGKSCDLVMDTIIPKPIEMKTSETISPIKLCKPADSIVVDGNVYYLKQQKEIND